MNIWNNALAIKKACFHKVNSVFLHILIAGVTVITSDIWAEKTVSPHNAFIKPRAPKFSGELPLSSLCSTENERHIIYFHCQSGL